jgi:3'-phosphoadenosine 5'-phosphosulfate sulfotransferase (PAPS reductase)/FAD synthetase
MKNYLSFGGGVNSVAMLLLMLDQEQNFEAVFVDHETDHPDTYKYVDFLQNWLVENGHDKITVIKPGLKRMGKVWNNLYNFHFARSLTPAARHRACTADFKVKPFYRYIDSPSWVMIGFAYDEAHRAKIATKNGVENRWPLIEHEITRQGCKEIIADHGLPIPRKSGCYICPMQKKGELIELRKNHPDLFCKVLALEEKNLLYQIDRHPDRKPYPLHGSGKRLLTLVDENQYKLFDDDIYPPCQCGL